MIVNCSNCSKEINRKPNDIKRFKNVYCCQKCMAESQKTGKNIECATCGKKVWRTVKQLEGSKSGRVFCSHSCSAVTSNEERSTGKYTYRQRALRWKEHKCERCGYNEVPEVLQVHHKNRDREDGSKENLEVLCPTCHMVEHFNAKDGAFSRMLINEV